MTGRLQSIHATAWYPPYARGGTEFYVEGLVEELAARKAGNLVLTPRLAGAPKAYIHGSAHVETWQVDPQPSSAELKGRVPPKGFEQFVALLSRFRGAIYHQHSWTRGCGPRHLLAARKLGFRTVLTVHVPEPICLRGTMLQAGVSPCDGRIDEEKCAACWLKSRGMNTALAGAVAAVPLGLSSRASRLDMRVATALGARSLAAARLRELREIGEIADRIVAVCEWLYVALVANGLPKSKLVLCPQGVSSRFLRDIPRTSADANPEGPLRLVFLGRWDRVKGIDIVVRAIRSLPADAPIVLTIHAIRRGGEPCAYEREVLALAGDDPRIRFEAPLARERLPSALSEHDVLVAPSQWLETGPLVVAEALAAGLFVLGSRLGGISELVCDGENGLLAPHSDVAAWAAAIAHLCVERPRRRTPTRAIRSMSQVAEEMINMYNGIA